MLGKKKEPMLDSIGDQSMDCAPPTGEISLRVKGSEIGGFSLLNCHFVFLRS
jgi:hypothetical protein